MPEPTFTIAAGMPHLTDERRFRMEEFGHYVAVLPWFNSDVLHKLYANVFAAHYTEPSVNEYDTRAITCADFINSPCIHRVDFNVFVIENELRNNLRNQMFQKSNDLVVQIGKFMLAYAKVCKEHLLSPRYKEAFKIEGSIVVNPTLGAKRIAAYVVNELNQIATFSKKIDSVEYYLDVIRNDDAQGVSRLEDFLKGLRRYGKEKEQTIPEEWKNLIPYDDTKSQETVRIKLPGTIRKRILEEIGIKATLDGGKKAKPRMFAVIVGVDDYADSRFPALNVISGARMFSEFLKQNVRENQLGEIKELYNQSASMRNLSSVFYDIRPRLQRNDIFLFYFTGHSVGSSDGQRAFQFFDDEVTLSELFGLISHIVRERAVEIIVISDCSGKDGRSTEDLWVDRSGFENLIWLDSGRRSKLLNAEELKDGGFTYSLLEIVRKRPHITYQQLADAIGVRAKDWKIFDGLNSNSSLFGTNSQGDKEFGHGLLSDSLWFGDALTKREALSLAELLGNMALAVHVKRFFPKKTDEFKPKHWSDEFYQNVMRDAEGIYLRELIDPPGKEVYSHFTRSFERLSTYTFPQFFCWSLKAIAAILKSVKPNPSVQNISVSFDTKSYEELKKSYTELASLVVATSNSFDLDKKRLSIAFPSLSRLYELNSQHWLSSPGLSRIDFGQNILVDNSDSLMLDLLTSFRAQYIHSLTDDILKPITFDGLELAAYDAKMLVTGYDPFKVVSPPWVVDARKWSSFSEVSPSETATGKQFLLFCLRQVQEIIEVIHSTAWNFSFELGFDFTPEEWMDIEAKVSPTLRAKEDKDRVRVEGVVSGYLDAFKKSYNLVKTYLESTGDSYPFDHSIRGRDHSKLS